MVAALKIDPARLPVPRLEPTRSIKPKVPEPVGLTPWEEAKTKTKPPVKKSWLWKPEKDAVLIEMYRAGKSDAEIADQLHMTAAQVGARVYNLRKAGGPLHDRPPRPRGNAWSDDHIEQLITMHKEGISSKEISEKLGRSRSAVDSMVYELKKQGRIERERKCGKKSSQ